MSKLLVLANEHTQFVVVPADILVEHIVWYVAIVVYILVEEGKHHIGIVHRGLPVCLLGKAIVVVVGLHYLDELVRAVVEVVLLRIVRQHLAHLLLGEAYHLVEGVREGVVRSDIESAREVVEGHGAHASDEDALDGRICTSLYRVEESAQVACAVCLALVFVETRRVREDMVGEMVIFVDEEVDLQTSVIAGLVQIV